MSSFLITGSSRGLGLELVKALAALPSTTVGTIYATARSSTAPDSLTETIKSSNSRVKFISLDVTSEKSVSAAASTVIESGGLDVLINNAGIQVAESSASVMKLSDLEITFSANVTSVARMINAFLPALKASKQKKIINISSTQGSMTLNPPGLSCSYKISKAALNSLTLMYANELGKEGFTVCALSPGWLKTELGSQWAHLEPHVGAKAAIDVVLSVTNEKDNGKFKDIYVEGDETYTGTNPPW